MPTKKSVASELKALIPNPVDRIKLDDYVTDLLRAFVTAIKTDSFWATAGQPTPQSIQQRLQFYEHQSHDLFTTCVLLGRWADDNQVQLLKRLFQRISELNATTGGFSFWNWLRWYPLSRLTYAAGIAALSANNYRVLPAVYLMPVFAERSEEGAAQIVVQTGSNMSQADDGFKMLPGHEQKRVPHSEYMFESLKEPLEELLFLGNGYEALFDEFEILLALSFADLTAKKRDSRIWGPVGRFGYRRALPGYVDRAKLEGAGWPPLKQGFFSSKQERFDEVSKAFLEFLGRVSFY